jgi:hypothetical protein
LYNKFEVKKVTTSAPSPPFGYIIKDLGKMATLDEKTFIELSNYLADKIDELERALTKA